MQAYFQCFAVRMMIAKGTNATNKELGPVSDSKMAAAVNVHTFELLL